MTALGPVVYFRHIFNVLDFAVVVSTLVELFYTSGPSLAALRCFRLVRILSTFKNWKSLASLLRTVIGSLEDFMHFGAIVLLFIFIFDLAGMQLLGGRMPWSRNNWDNFGWGAITTFQVRSQLTPSPDCCATHACPSFAAW